MQHVENDMDDLFQRAAENYPLDAGKGDWENIARQIADKSVPDVVAAKKEERKRRWPFLFLLFFALPIGWLMIHRDNPSSLPQVAGKPVVLNSKAADPVAGSKTLSVADGLKNAIVPGDKDEVIGRSGKGIFKTGSKTLMLARQADIDEMRTENSIPEIFVERLPTADLELNKYKRGINGDMIFSKNMLAGFLQKNNSPVVDSKVRKKAKTSLDKEGFYAGVIAGPDFSKVQSMAFSNTGNMVGLVAGFQVNKNLSFETGISWNKKYYQSKGVSFNMDKVGATMAGMAIADLSGQSSLIEIPVKVKYDWLNKTKSNFFITGGLSAYIMTHEKNKYNLTMNGNPQKLTGVYNDNNYGLPAVASFSIGYEHHITRGLQIRIEPVLKIPLKGMGVGSLPITSAGLQIGLIRRLK